ncbi:MAPEG family protein [Paralimibaculum aggregatum]|uniref:MAPEG family protein n=1 Tax=Paralimibaculum aggregatum TaxID=3036245 RepID=A0ABQ6LNM0_9RHOB|nr:MAPEG family protein [Limibaculum sp. NKW23]GMG83302.1 MAPEG family protein [Limibaculum sp. NKW23]
MAVELQVLAAAVLLAGVQLALFAVPANLEIGSDYTTGPRDTPPPRPLSVRWARLQRAFANHIENLVLFGAAAAAVVLGGKSSALTEALALAYILARIAYVPAYASGVRYLRSAVFGIGWAATMALAAAALL